MTGYGIYFIKKLDYPGKGIRYISNETTQDLITKEEGPLLELTDTGDRVLHLSFVRSTPERSLDFLLERTLSFAKHNGFQTVELQDDAFFKTHNNLPCLHRELYNRAFNGLKGIYESKGWKTAGETESLIHCITSFTKGDAKELGVILGTKQLNTFSDDDQESFGKWINSQSCETLNYFYNNLLSLAARRKLPPMSDKAAQFLRAFHELRIANSVLHHDPAFTPSPRRLTHLPM